MRQLWARPFYPTQEVLLLGLTRTIEANLLSRVLLGALVPFSSFVRSLLPFVESISSGEYNMWYVIIFGMFLLIIFTWFSYKKRMFPPSEAHPFFLAR